jgi:hypothetical protein
MPIRRSRETVYSYRCRVCLLQEDKIIEGYFIPQVDIPEGSCARLRRRKNKPAVAIPSVGMKSQVCSRTPPA